jgi:hypothetical protein
VSVVVLADDGLAEGTPRRERRGGAIASRILARDESGEVELVSLDGGSELAPLPGGEGEHGTVRVF